MATTTDARNVAVRVDSSMQIGTGHFIRCLALADELRQRGAHVCFVSRQVTEDLRALVMANGHEFVPNVGAPEHDPADTLRHAAWLGTSRAADARDTLTALSGRDWDWLVVDHYALDARWESAMRGAARRILVIDDIADRLHDCDLLLDHNAYCAPEDRHAAKVPERCRLLLGPRYALLRSEFGRLRSTISARTGNVRRVLIFFGGIDAGAHTGHAIEAVAGLGRTDLEVDVVIGAQHPHRPEIEARCTALGYACHVHTRRMAELMARADVALGAGGTASWERCCLGLPTLTLCVAENQRQLVEDAALAGLLYGPAIRPADAARLASHLQALMDNPALLRAISYSGMRAVDGYGAQRVLRTMGFGAVSVREATGSDSAKVLEWRNRPAVRAASRNPEAIERATHDVWFRAALASPDRLLLIGERDGDDIGVVRFDVRGSTAEVSIYLAPGAGGRGNGAELLHAAESWLARNRPEVGTVEAEVRRENPRSHGLFRGGGYRLESSRYEKRFA